MKTWGSVPAPVVLLCLFMLSTLSPLLGRQASNPPVTSAAIPKLRGTIKDPSGAAMTGVEA